MRVLQFVVLFSSLYSQYHISEWGSITSLLTPTEIQITDEGIVYASTAGGLLKFNPTTEKYNFIKMEQGLKYLDLSTIAIDSYGRLWLGGAYPRACMQVYDPASGSVKYYKEWLDDDGDNRFEFINRIQIDENIAFAVYKDISHNEMGILRFNIDSDGMPDYKDDYTDFTDDTITEIRDLDIFQDSLYVTTDQGVFVGNYTDNLKFSTFWNAVYIGDDAMQFLPGETPLIIGNSSIFNPAGEDYCIEFTGDIIQAARKDDIIRVLTEENYYEIYDCTIDSFPIPVGDQSNTYNRFGDDLRTFFTSFDYNQEGDVFIGIRDNGILTLDLELENYVIHTPNTPLINSFQAITITKSGHLAATTNLGTLYFDGIDYRNYIPNGVEVSQDNYYQYYSGSSETFHAFSLDYGIGEQLAMSIIEKDNGNLIYGNSGIYTGEGAVIELDIKTDSLTIYDNTDNIIDGWYGIIDQDDFTHYTWVNQIEKDEFGNIWVTNPYCEEDGNLLAIQSADDNAWSHVYIPDENSYLPQTIAIETLDSYQRAWIGFEYKVKSDDTNTNYSSGGIKVLKYTDLSFEEEDSTWFSIENPEDLPGNSATASVWSLVFDHRGWLWVLNEHGIRGYTYSINNSTNSITLEPKAKYSDGTAIDYLYYIGYEPGNRIRVDSQNNKWIITHQGVWVLQESMVFWPSKVTGPIAEGIHSKDFGLLSDIVYDVAFDNDKGLAYLATDQGISILQIPFADNPSNAESMYISPNPFIIPDDDFVMIKNIPSGSTIQIMTITGLMIKKVRLEPEYSTYLWDGRNNYGEVVGTAVYLVAAHHPSETNKVSKIAVIRK